MGWWPFGKREDPAQAQRLAEVKPFDYATVAFPVLAPRALTSDEIRARKRARAEGLPQPAISADPPAARMAALVRDKDGRPRFDRDPRTFPSATQEAWKRMMTADEIREYFA